MPVTTTTPFFFFLSQPIDGGLLGFRFYVTYGYALLGFVFSLFFVSVVFLGYVSPIPPSFYGIAPSRWGCGLCTLGVDVVSRLKCGAPGACMVL